MQLYPILLLVIVLAADGGVRLTQRDFGLTGLEITAIAIAPVAVVFALAWLVIRMCDRRLHRGGTAKPIGIAERAVRYGRGLLLANHVVALLVFGWLDVIRASIGDLILIDELVAITPAILGALALWWAYYPIERRIRETLLIRRLDMGKPVYPTPSRGRYVMLQFRVGMLILLVPIVVILGIAESIHVIVHRITDPQTAAVISNSATIVAAAGVFVCAPLLMRVFLSVEPLPEGPVRDELLQICRRHNVRVRELLLWKTSGSMINAAVMGLLGRLRYVLVTDALLETMNLEQLKAVMAHEVGHVRRHHMPWLVITFAAIIFATLWLIEAPLALLQAAGVQLMQAGGQAAGMALLAGQLALALLIFGWVCRRFERQADTFAVQHLSGLARPDVEYGEVHPRIEPQAVDAMRSALEAIAQLNAVDPRRPSWRHGSIAWRQAYLESITGAPLEELPIDRLIRYIKRAAAVVLALTLGAWLLLL